MRQAAGSPPAAPQRDELPRGGERRFYAATREGKKRITVHLDAQTHRELRQLALDIERSAEAIVIEALADKLASHRGRR